MLRTTRISVFVMYKPKNLTLNQLKELKNKTLYINDNGAVVACRFTDLEVYLHGDYDDAKYFRWHLKLANDSEMCQYHGAMPKVYYTIDDCVNGRNSLYLATINTHEVLKLISTERGYRDVIIKGKVKHAYVYKRDKETLKITKRGIGHVRYDIIKDKFWDGCGPTYDEFVCYKTYEECAKKSKIEVVTFK